MKIVTTLCIVHDHPKILLGMKKRGFGVGLWNGFGGKVKKGESVVSAAHREMHEECGLVVPSIEPAGVLDLLYNDQKEHVEMHIFRATSHRGEVCESEEMEPRWFSIDEIPFKEMWQSDRYWYPLFLEGKKFCGKFIFDNKYNVIEHEMTIRRKE